MKPTSLVLLFAATALAVPQAIVSTAASSAPSAATPSTPAAAFSSITPTTAAFSSPPSVAVATSAKSKPNPTKTKPTASPSSNSILSSLNAAACKRVIAGNAATIAQIAKLKANGVAIPPYLSGYLIAAKAAESELGCSASASAST